MLISIIIRTYNEEQYLEQLLKSITNQKHENFDIEIIIVDSGSTDNTLIIASTYHCRITHIKKEDFTFGRSLNIGCTFSNGNILTFISGHCIPKNNLWLNTLIEPLITGKADYSYGRQEGKDTTKYSEYRHFDKFFPTHSQIPQQGYFCNNANAAISRSAWEKYQFDENLTGLEDMYLARKLIDAGKYIAYVAEASVYHIHNESWLQVRTRYEREAYALHKIMPEMHFHISDFFKCFSLSLKQDYTAAFRDGVLFKKAYEIFMFRLMLYWGTYRGNHELRQLSNEMKRAYFYPTHKERNTHEKTKGYSTITHESKQHTS